MGTMILIIIETAPVVLVLHLPSDNDITKEEVCLISMRIGEEEEKWAVEIIRVPYHKLAIL